MPGVPTGRACDACRQQKKKCDEKQPACGRCLRLKISCVGCGQRRYKFKHERFSPNLHQSNQNSISLQLTSTRKEIPPVEIPRGCPGNHMTSLMHSFVAAIKRTTDLRYNMWWSFGIFMEEIPRRLGSNAALDCAVDAVTLAHTGFCTRQPVSVETLIKYSHALKTLKVYLDDPTQASASNTLCAVMVLLVCQTLIGNDLLVTGHAQGAANILHARKNFGPRDDFERKLFLSLRGCVLFEGLYNDDIDLSDEEWDSLVSNDYDQALPEGQILCCLARAPVIMRRGKRAIRNHEDLTPLTEEVRPIYETCKSILSKLKSRNDEFQISELNTGPESFRGRILRAHYHRTYGIGIAVTTFFNCMLQALNPGDYICVTEARSLVKDTLAHAHGSNMYRPVGAGYVLMCLSVAWAVAAEPQIRSMVEAALIDYHGDFAFHNGLNFSRDMERASESLWLGSRPRLRAALSPDSPWEYRIE